MPIKHKKHKIPDVRLILLLVVFIGLPIALFINWIVVNNQVGTLIKMLIIFISVAVTTIIYVFIRYLFTIKTDKLKKKSLTYILVQSISLIITLIVIGLIILCV